MCGSMADTLAIRESGSEGGFLHDRPRAVAVVSDLAVKAEVSAELALAPAPDDDKE
jgi:hypothetical protein